MPRPTQTSAIAIVGDEKGDSFTPLYFWNALINGQECVLTAGGALPSQAEVLAPVHLRTKLNLETGDALEIVVV